MVDLKGGLQRMREAVASNHMNRNRLRYKVFTSFALAVLGIVAMARLWTVAPPSPHMWAPYGTVAILVIAGFWRGIIFARAASARTD